MDYAQIHANLFLFAYSPIRLFAALWAKISNKRKEDFEEQINDERQNLSLFETFLAQTFQ